MTLYADSPGQLSAMELSDRNSRAARNQQGLQFIAGLLQQKKQNEMQERQFQQNQENLSNQFMQRQQALDSEKILAEKGLAAKAADLDFRKTHEKFLVQKWGEEMNFKEDQAAVNAQLYEQEQGINEAEGLYDQVSKMGAAVDPYDANRLFGDKIDPKRKEMLVRQTTGAFEDQNNQFNLASNIAEALNRQQEVENQINEYVAGVGNNQSMTKAEKKAQEVRVAHLKELKGKTASFRNAKGDLKSQVNQLLTIDEDGNYIPLIKKPKTFRDLYPEPVTDTGASLGKIREMDREEAPADLGSYAAWMNPQNGAQSTGTGNPLVDAGLVDPQYPVTPQGAPSPNPMWDLGAPMPESAVVPSPVQQGSVDPRLALYKAFLAKGVPKAQALIMADEALKGAASQQLMNMERFRP